jgi:uncharacterized protein
MERPRFLVDEMLGSLVRWLRILGYDTVYVRNMKDTEVLEQARREDRCLLTRDRQLAGRAGNRGLLLTSTNLDEQLAQVAAAYHIGSSELMTRCTLCNGLLIRAKAEAVSAEVPERVRELHDEFFVCQSCGQVYWKGTHWDRINERLARIVRP